jgi:C1A family cysteine protease
MYKAPSGVKLFADDKLSGEDYKFMAYVSEYGKSYGTVAEFMFRKEQFVTRHNEIEAFNADANNTHTVGHNLFSDKTFAEMKKLNGYIAAPLRESTAVPLDESNLAASIDWRSKNAVTPVKNQAQCGSCWAFSTTGAVEGADAIKSGSLKSFSEQQLVSCSKQNSACNGGLMDYAFQYIKTNPLELESNYPYTSGTGRVASCSYSKSRGVGTVSAFTDVQHTATQMRAALAKGPVSVAIEADQMAFQSYTSGVITSGCGTNLDHGVLAVGYGTLGGQ